MSTKTKQRPQPSALLQRLGRRVRSRRKELGWTGKELAEHAGLSRRFVAQVEAGEGNIAIGRLHGLADALGVQLESLVGSGSAPAGTRLAIDRLLAGRSPAELRRALAVLELLFDARPRRVVALLGVRGAGKSTMGPGLAESLGIPFVELDGLIEEAAGLRLSDIFVVHGEPYYRRLTRRCLAEVLGRDEPCVLALPGGVVTDREAAELIQQGCLSVWLRADAEAHMRRVLAQGDRRPMAGREDAMAELRSLIEARAPLYEQADLIVDTTRESKGEVLEALVEAVSSEWVAP
jgi:XRE family aerobic/anaerobic benzoate catabolism transcriptional regulator